MSPWIFSAADLRRRGRCLGDDVSWLTARKMARHLNLAPPPRDVPGAVEQFLRTYRRRYLAACEGWG